MPQEAIKLFPRLRAATDRSAALSSRLDATSQVEQAEEAVERAAGKPARRGRGQGFQLDQEVKVAVEVRAMNAATEFYEALWDVEDVHGKESYDLVCRRGDDVMRVEVKGTASDGAEVMLTPNEVKHARENRHTALFVLSDVRVERAEDGTVTATGGMHHVCDPWNIDEGILMLATSLFEDPAAGLHQDASAKLSEHPALLSCLILGRSSPPSSVGCHQDLAGGYEEGTVAITESDRILGTLRRGTGAERC